MADRSEVHVTSPEINLDLIKPSRTILFVKEPSLCTALLLYQLVSRLGSTCFGYCNLLTVNEITVSVTRSEESQCRMLHHAMSVPPVGNDALTRAIQHLFILYIYNKEMPLVRELVFLLLVVLPASYVLTVCRVFIRNRLVSFQGTNECRHQRNL